MKKLLIAFVVLTTTMTTSCQKEEIVPTSSIQVMKRDQSSDPQIPLNQTSKPLSENEELFDLISNSDEMKLITSQGGLIENGQVIHFGDPKKFVVVFPQDSLGTTMEGWTLSIYDGKIFNSNIVSLKESDNYIYGEQFSGVIEIKDLNGNMLVGGTMVNGKFPQWTHHGGYGSWADCVVASSGTWWGFVGSVVAPGATLVGISLGCL